MRLTLFSIVAVALVLGAGCKKGPVTTLKTDVPDPQPEQSWKYYKEDGFSIGCPDYWGKRPMNPLAGQMGIPVEEPDEPTPEDLEEMAEKGLLIILYDKNSRQLPGEWATRMYIKMEETGGMTIDEGVEQVKSSLGGVTEERKLDLEIGPCVELKREIKSMAGDENYQIVYVLVNDKQLWRVAFECTGAGRMAIDQVAEPMIRTFRVHPVAN